MHHSADRKLRRGPLEHHLHCRIHVARKGVWQRKLEGPLVLGEDQQLPAAALSLSLSLSLGSQ